MASAFEERYGNKAGLISGRQKRGRLALVTVTSALGRSSIYNRLRLMRGAPGQSDPPAVELLKLGTTTGYGHSQITDELFAQLRTVLQEMCTRTLTGINSATVRTGGFGLRDRHYSRSDWTPMRF